MKGFSRKSLAAGCLAAGLLSNLAGCHEGHNLCDRAHDCYDSLVDPCWPQRYNQIAKGEVNAPLAAQITNGLAMDQTIWNYHFKDGTDQLNPMGQAHLDRLVRRRPGPYPEVYVQTAHDIKLTPGQLQKFAADRSELDGKRIKAVQDYLTAVGRGAAFNVAVSDMSPAGMSGTEARQAVGSMQRTASGYFGVPMGDAQAGTTLQQAQSASGQGGASR